MARTCATKVLFTTHPLVLAIQRAHRYSAFSVEPIEAQVPFLKLFRRNADKNAKLSEGLLCENLEAGVNSLVEGTHLVPGARPR
jgi:hypothetical protein